MSGTGLPSTGIVSLPGTLLILDISNTNVNVASFLLPDVEEFYASGPSLPYSGPLSLVSFQNLKVLDLSKSGVTFLGFAPGLVSVDVSGSAITGTLPALPAALTYLDVSDTSITAFAGTTAATGLKTLLAGGAPLPAVPSPLPAATLEYVYNWQPACEWQRVVASYV